MESIEKTREQVLARIERFAEDQGRIGLSISSTNPIIQKIIVERKASKEWVKRFDVLFPTEEACTEEAIQAYCDAAALAKLERLDVGDEVDFQLAAMNRENAAFVFSIPYTGLAWSQCVELGASLQAEGILLREYSL